MPFIPVHRNKVHGRDYSFLCHQFVKAFVRDDIYGHCVPPSAFQKSKGAKSWTPISWCIIKFTLGFLPLRIDELVRIRL